MLTFNLILLFMKLVDYVLEAGTWELDGFGKGVYLTAVRDGLVLWNEVSK